MNIGMAMNAVTGICISGSDAQAASEQLRMSTVTSAVHSVENYPFEAGMCYLFFTDARGRSLSDALWGIFDRRMNEQVLLEVASSDLRMFGNWTELPARYRFVRCMMAAEMRDFCYNLGFAEACALIGPPLPVMPQPES